MGIKDWMRGLFELSPEAQAVLDAEIEAIQTDGNEVVSSIQQGLKGKLQEVQQEADQITENSHKQAVLKAKQDLEEALSTSISEINAFFEAYDNDEDCEAISERILYVKVLEINTLISRIHRNSIFFNTIVKNCVKRIGVFGEVPQDFLDDIEAKRGALKLTVENKMRELEEKKAGYEEKLEELKGEASKGGEGQSRPSSATQAFQKGPRDIEGF